MMLPDRHSLGDAWKSLHPDPLAGCGNFGSRRLSACFQVFRSVGTAFQ